MAPILLLGGAAALFLLGRKKEEDADEGITISAAPVIPSMPGIPSGALQDVEVIEATRLIPARTKKNLVLEVQRVEEEVEEEPTGIPWDKPVEEEACKIGQVSQDKSHVCWGIPGTKGASAVKMRRVVKYETAQKTAAMLALAGPAATSLLKKLPIQFALWCWVNRKKGIYKCTKERKLGRKKWCSKWGRHSVKDPYQYAS